MDFHDFREKKQRINIHKSSHIFIDSPRIVDFPICSICSIGKKTWTIRYNRYQIHRLNKARWIFQIFPPKPLELAQDPTCWSPKSARASSTCSASASSEGVVASRARRKSVPRAPPREDDWGATGSWLLAGFFVTLWTLWNIWNLWNLGIYVCQ